MKFIRKKFIWPTGRTSWAVTCEELGSLEFWATKSPHPFEEYYGGVERHYNEKNAFLSLIRIQIMITA